MGVPVIELHLKQRRSVLHFAKLIRSMLLLRHLMDPCSRKIPVMEFDVLKVLEEFSLTMDQFIELCILCGCEYCDSIKDRFEAYLSAWLSRDYSGDINRERLPFFIFEDSLYVEARRLFKEPLVCVDEEQLGIKWSAPEANARLRCVSVCIFLLKRGRRPLVDITFFYNQSILFLLWHFLI